jgi:hypothetical protein
MGTRPAVQALRRAFTRLFARRTAPLGSS